MENPQLLAAVLRAPDDDGPRARYAAWCARQQDEPTRARAAFIEAQLVLARESETLDHRRRSELRLRSDHLVRGYGREWAGLTARLVREFRFDRGFVEVVTMDASDFLLRAEMLFNDAPIRHLDLTGVASVAEALFQSPLLQSIRSLDLARNGLTDEHVMLLAASPYLRALRWLSLADNRISFDGAEALARSPLSEQLVYVVFHGNPFEPNERYSYDDGFVVDSWIPDDGVALETSLGRELPWLRHRARTIEDAIPDRFRSQGQTSGAR